VERADVKPAAQRPLGLGTDPADFGGAHGVRRDVAGDARKQAYAAAAGARRPRARCRRGEELVDAGDVAVGEGAVRVTAGCRRRSIPSAPRVG
jgi:hypothetical protein